MTKRHLSLRVAASAILTTALAAMLLALAPASPASAVTGTYISLHPVAATPLAGQQLTMQVFTGSLDGSYPAGAVDVSVEGTGMIVGGNVNTSTGGIQVGVGIFPIGTITVDASFTPANGIYAGTSTKTVVTITGDSVSIRPLFLSAPTLGKPVSADAIIFLDADSTHAPGGVVSFLVGGVSVGTCTPAATGTTKNWSCTATLPAPTKSGAYSLTTSFGRSTYYQPATGTLAVTVAAPPPAAPKPAAPKPAAPKAAAAASTPAPTPTPSPTPTDLPTGSAVPLAAAANPTSARSAVPSPAEPWLWLFLGALTLLVAAGVAAVVWRIRVLRRSTGNPEVS